MCGIAGIKSTNGNAEVEAMLDLIQYRGPDARNIGEVGKWTLGHVRLSIIDLETGGQPMSHETSGAMIVFNGEIYNFGDIRATLGGLYNTRSDTEVLLKLHSGDEEPETWLNRLDGMFSIAIADEKGLLLARDPLGVKPLYVGIKDKQIIFASEIKAILPLTTRVMEFPPGYVYTTAGGSRPYRKVKAAPTKTQNPSTIAKTLREAVTRSVQTRMLSDVPLGVFLSGGLDSSIIAAIAKTADPKLKTFAVGFADSPDIIAARRVAEFLGTDHYERIITLEQAVRALPRVIRHLESYDAALVRSAIPNYFLAELASQHVKVALSGEGADELFAGYAYLSDLPADKLHSELLHITLDLHHTNLQRCDRMSMAHGLEVRVPYLDDIGLVEYALGLPTSLKRPEKSGVEKWILRKSFETFLPEEIVWREKAKFAQGAGLSDHLSKWGNAQFSDDEYADQASAREKFGIRNKEELAYFTLFSRRFSADHLSHMVGRSRSL